MIDSASASSLGRDHAAEEVQQSPIGLQLADVSFNDSGQATISIPIEAPPGISGQTPKLALVYASRQGNGLMGVGWFCQGLSAITRTRPIYAIDGFNAPISYTTTDRYALDGQRLIATHGVYGAADTVYQTEVQSWNLVREKDGGFIVTARNGDTLEYGTTTDSRILAAGRTEVRVWALHATADKHGNRIEYNYIAPQGIEAANAGSYYLDEIRYTIRNSQTGGRAIKFYYENRPDPIVYYIGGAPVIETRRLAQITTSLGVNGSTNEILRYSISYETSTATQLSRVVSIAAAERSTVAESGFEIAKLLWSDTPVPSLGAPGLSSTMDRAGLDNVISADVTGNGCSDVVQFYRNASGILSSAAYLSYKDDGEVKFKSAVYSLLDRFPAESQIFSADVDGDGKIDLVIGFKGQNGRLKLSVFLSSGDGSFIEAANSPYATDDPWDLDAGLPFFSMDVNGDGRTDIVKAYAKSDGTLAFRSYLSKFDGGTTGFTNAVVSSTADPAKPANLLAFWPMDVNGDGMMDLVRVWSDVNGRLNATSYISACPAPATATASFPDTASSNRDAVSFSSKVNTVLSAFGSASFMPVDVNGDGIQDLLQIWQDASGATLHLNTYLCDAAGGFVAGPQSNFSNMPMPNARHLYPMGLNGGGQVSLVSLRRDTDGNWKTTVLQGAPSGKFRLLDGGPVIHADPNSLFLPCDPDGNGKADLVQVYLNSDGTPLLAPLLSVGPANDLAISVNNAIGGTVELAYAPLTDAAVYTPMAAAGYPNMPGLRYPHPLTPTQFPAQAIIGQAVYVLRELRRRPEAADSPFPYTRHLAMRYEGAQIDLNGRGWQGFAATAVTDMRTGLVEQRRFHRSFPYTGLAYETRIAADGRYSTDPRVPKDKTVLMATTSMRFVATLSAATTPVQLLLMEKRATDYDYGENHLDRERAESFSYDAFGNAISHTGWGYVEPGTLSPLASDEVVYRYASFRNDVDPNGGWALGFPVYIKVSANATDADIATFQAGDLKLDRRDYASVTYDVIASAQWDDTHGSFLTTAYTYADSGNCISETPPGGLATTFDYDATFETFRTRTTSPPNAQGLRLVTERGYDPRFGTEVARQDPDGAISVKALDGFGRMIALQGPIPSSGVSSNPNQTTAVIAASPGLAMQFRAAEVVTIETKAYVTGADGLHRTDTSALQSFPDGTARNFAWHRAYVDGTGAERASFTESGQAEGNVLTLSDYDEQGRPTGQSLPFFASSIVGSQAPHAISTVYDVIGRPILRRAPIGETGEGVTETTWAYSTDGQVTEVQAAGTSVSYQQIREHHVYDGHDKVRRTVSGNEAGVATFDYDRLGRLLASTDPATVSNPHGVTNRIVYDSLNRRKSVDDPDRNTTGKAEVHALAFAYNATTGRLQIETDAAGATTVYSYDALGRVIEKAFGDGSIIYLTYDDPATPHGKGRLTRAERCAPDGQLLTRQNISYDAYGNQAASVLTVQGESASFSSSAVFDPLKRPVQNTHPDGSLATWRYSYGRLVSSALSNLPDNTANIGVLFPLEKFTSTGRPGQAIYGEGSLSGGCATATYRYSPTGQLYGETMEGAAGKLLDETLAYDALSQLLTVTPASGTEGRKSYAYTDRRLVSAAVPGFQPTTYSYDAASDLKLKDGIDYAFRAHFAYEGTRGGVVVYSAEADACGRTIARTSGNVTQRFAYDALGQLAVVASEEGHVLSSMLNDHRGTRVRHTEADGSVTIFIGSTYQVHRSPAGISTITRYLGGATGPVARVETGGTAAGGTFVRADHKGDVTHLLDTVGALLTVVSYNGYGEYVLLSGSEVPSRSYESKTRETATGFYYFGARYYDPASGRFLTPDSQLGGTDVFHPGVFNRYAFELGNPIGYRDPSGHMPDWAWGLIIGLVVVAAGVIIIATLGAASPLAAAVIGGAILSAGVSATMYSINHTNGDFSWKDYGIQSAISFGIGAATGAAFVGLGAGISSFGLQGARALLANTLGGALIGGIGDVGGQFFTNLAEQNDLSSGLAASAVFGVVFGGLGGALGAKLASRVESGALRTLGEEEPQMRVAAQIQHEDEWKNFSPPKETTKLIGFPRHPEDLVDNMKEQRLANLMNNWKVRTVTVGTTLVTGVPESYLENRNWMWST